MATLVLNNQMALVKRGVTGSRFAASARFLSHVEIKLALTLAFVLLMALIAYVGVALSATVAVIAAGLVVAAVTPICIFMALDDQINKR
ncbi:MAG: hypothetical protein PUK59_02500 [Actinomycetaceae bacterium]|nr:hypothetical protein [Actinomycetaceae bacterium]